MAKIVINGRSHKESCLWPGQEDDASAYEAHIGDYLAWVRAKAEAAGHEFSVDENGRASSSYSVIADDHDDEASAHWLMQSLPDFWSWVC